MKPVTSSLRLLAEVKYMASRYGTTAAELAQEFGIAIKTARRDLALIGDVGFPIYEDIDESHPSSPKNPIRYFIERDWVRQNLEEIVSNIQFSLTSQQALTLLELLDGKLADAEARLEMLRENDSDLSEAWRKRRAEYAGIKDAILKLVQRAA